MGLHSVPVQKESDCIAIALFLCKVLVPGGALRVAGYFVSPSAFSWAACLTFALWIAFPGAFTTL